MVDPCGMLTAKAFAPSWLPAVACGGHIWIPSRLDTAQIEQELRDGWQNRVVTHFKVLAGLVWQAEAMAFRHGDPETKLSTQLAGGYQFVAEPDQHYDCRVSVDH
jgi:hypothetical protein